MRLDPFRIDGLGHYRARTGETPVQNAYVPLTKVPAIPIVDLCYTGHIRDQDVMRDLAETYGDYQRWSLP